MPVDLEWQHTKFADLAYSSAVQAIRRPANRSEDRLDLNVAQFNALERIPHEIGTLRRLQVLVLDRTSIEDLSILSATPELLALSLLDTKVADWSPLSSLRSHEHLSLSFTRVVDLRPICHLDMLGRTGHPGLTFRAIPALEQDQNLLILSEIEDSRDRSRETIAYLNTLPTWPVSYTPRARPDSPPPQPIGDAPQLMALFPALRTPEAQVGALLRHAIVTRVTASQLADQIAIALRGLPARDGNQLPPILQLMSEVGEVLDMMGRAQATATQDERNLRLRLAQLEVLVERLKLQVADAEAAKKAVEALAAKEGFPASYKKSLGTSAGVATAGIVPIGVRTAAIYFLGVEHPLVPALLTAVGRLPR